MNKDKDSADQYRIELVLALVASILLTIVYQRDVLFASNDLYPSAYDFLGHMAKIEYIADSFKAGILPSWYPHWYSGSAVVQYYPPFSYLCLVPVYMVSGSAMVTFKFFSFSVVLIGALGVWRLCRLYIGKWSGFVGILIFCSSPFIQQIVIELGQVAQGPVIALTPWYMLSVLDIINTLSRKSWCKSTCICALMILSHANSAFMLCFSMMLVFAILMVVKKIGMTEYMIVAASIVFAGAMTAFWSLVGVTGLENAGVPYLIEEAVAIHTATAEWFYNSAHQYYFSIVALVGAICAVIVFLKRKISSTCPEEDIFMPFVILMFLITIAFSFGEKIILFKYIPMHKSIVAGRILAITVFPASILWAYMTRQCFALTDNSIISQTFKRGISFAFIALLVLDTSPAHMERIFWGQTFYDTTRISPDLSPIEYENYYNKGRATLLGAFDGGMAYYPVKQGYALGDGYNIEGTIHHKYLRNQAIANVSNAFDYIKKNLAFHNIRYLVVHPVYQETMYHLNDFHEHEDELVQASVIDYVCDAPSTYVLSDKRNALIIGPGSTGIAIEFPYLVHDDRNDIYDFSLDELSRYRLVYLSEPDLSTVDKKNKTEEMIKKILEGGAVVVVAPAPMPTYRFNLFGVVPQYYGAARSGVLYKTDTTSFGGEREPVEISVDGAFFKGLDESNFAILHENATAADTVIGAKNVDEGKVVFIGMNLSHHLRSVSVINWGTEKMNMLFSDETFEMKGWFEDLFDFYGVETNFDPKGFATENFRWDHRNIYFDYALAKTEEVTISITYAPRWKAYVNGSLVHVGQRENLITLQLPSGENSVQMVYGITKYGAMGYGISVVFAVMFLICVCNYKKIIEHLDVGAHKFKSVMEILD